MTVIIRRPSDLGCVHGCQSHRSERQAQQVESLHANILAGSQPRPHNAGNFHQCAVGVIQPGKRAGKLMPHRGLRIAQPRRRIAERRRARLVATVTLWIL